MPVARNLSYYSCMHVLNSPVYIAFTYFKAYSYLANLLVFFLIELHQPSNTAYISNEGCTNKTQIHRSRIHKLHFLFSAILSY